jgi:hypothetical protein
MLTFLLVGGYYARSIPVFISWVRYISFLYWGFNILTKIQFRFAASPCRAGPRLTPAQQHPGQLHWSGHAGPSCTGRSHARPSIKSGMVLSGFVVHFCLWGACGVWRCGAPAGRAGCDRAAAEHHLAPQAAGSRTVLRLCRILPGSHHWIRMDCDLAMPRLSSPSSISPLRQS